MKFSSSGLISRAYLRNVRNSTCRCDPVSDCYSNGNPLLLMKCGMESFKHFQISLHRLSHAESSNIQVLFLQYRGHIRCLCLYI